MTSGNVLSGSGAKPVRQTPGTAQEGHKQGRAAMKRENMYDFKPGGGGLVVHSYRWEQS